METTATLQHTIFGYIKIHTKKKEQLVFVSRIFRYQRGAQCSGDKKNPFRLWAVTSAQIATAEAFLSQKAPAGQPLDDFQVPLHSIVIPPSFPSDVLFSPPSLTGSQLWEESEHASSSEGLQTGEYCQKNNLHNTKAFVSSPLSGRQVVTVGTTWRSLWKSMGTEVSSKGKPQKQEEDLCLSTKHIIEDAVFYSVLFC